MNTLEEELYKEKIEKSYYLTLRDLLMGVTYEELVEDMYEFEHKEMYELCAGIKKALSYAKRKTYSEIKIELEENGQKIEY